MHSVQFLRTGVIWKQRYGFFVREVGFSYIFPYWSLKHLSAHNFRLNDANDFMDMVINSWAMMHTPKKWQK